MHPKVGAPHPQRDRGCGDLKAARRPGLRNHLGFSAALLNAQPGVHLTAVQVRAHALQRDAAARGDQQARSVSKAQRGAAVGAAFDPVTGQQPVAQHQWRDALQAVAPHLTPQVDHLGIAGDAPQPGQGDAQQRAGPEPSRLRQPVEAAQLAPIDLVDQVAGADVDQGVTGLHRVVPDPGGRRISACAGTGGAHGISRNIAWNIARHIARHITLRSQGHRDAQQHGGRSTTKQRKNHGQVA